MGRVNEKCQQAIADEEMDPPNVCDALSGDRAHTINIGPPGGLEHGQ